mgnify:FL=1
MSFINVVVQQKVQLIVHQMIHQIVQQTDYR